MINGQAMTAEHPKDWLTQADGRRGAAFHQDAMGPSASILDALTELFLGNFKAGESARLPMAWFEVSHSAGFMPGNDGLAQANKPANNAFSLQTENLGTVLHFSKKFLTWQKKQFDLSRGFRLVPQDGRTLAGSIGRLA